MPFFFFSIFLISPQFCQSFLFLTDHITFGNTLDGRFFFRVAFFFSLFFFLLTSPCFFLQEVIRIKKYHTCKVRLFSSQTKFLFSQNLQSPQVLVKNFLQHVKQGFLKKTSSISEESTDLLL